MAREIVLQYLADVMMVRSFHCRWQNGECRFGDRCNFAHGDDELRQLPPRGDVPPSGGRGGRGRGGGYYREGGYEHGYGGRGGGGGRGEFYPRDHGMHGHQTQEHQAWVASGCPVAGKGGWTQYSTPSGEKYCHNAQTDETTWDMPAEFQ